MVFAATTMSSQNPFLLGNVGHFDYVLLQESSMLIETVALGPALLGKIFIMFGDHYLINP